MAHYVISDIHGALDTLKKLMRRAGICLEEDELYLLGDYVDWGTQSMETLLYVMELSEGPHADHVHCLLGNHEEMFLQTIREHRACPEDRRESVLSGAMFNWLHRNSGIDTWLAYLDLDPADRDRIRKWLEALPLSAEAALPDGRLYLLGHAYPYFYDMDHFPEDAERERSDTVWRRLLPHEDPFADYRGEKRYRSFICGHTITDHYYKQIAGESGRRKKLRPCSNRIFKGERFIDIDCGAKLLSLRTHMSEEVRAEAAKCRLACLRLDDGKVFYAR